MHVCMKIVVFSRRCVPPPIGRTNVVNSRNVYPMHNIGRVMRFAFADQLGVG